MPGRSHWRRLLPWSLGLLLLTGACSGSSSSDKPHHLPSSADGEVVVLAGGDKPYRNGDRLDGSVAGASISPTGAITAGPDGSIYFGVNAIDERQGGPAKIVRLRPNGQLSTVASGVTRYFDSLRLRSGMLWLFSADDANTAQVRQFPLTAATPDYFPAGSDNYSLIGPGSISDERAVVIRDSTGAILSTQQRSRVVAGWQQRGLVFTKQGQPLIILADGTAYQLQAPDGRKGVTTVKAVVVPGLSAALSRLPGDAQILDTVQNGDGAWTALTTSGMISIPADGKAAETRYFDKLTQLPRLYSAVKLPDDTIIATPYQTDQVDVVYPNGRTHATTVPVSKSCAGGDKHGRLPSPYGLAFRPPDQVVISSWGCNRLYTVNQKAFGGS